MKIFTLLSIILVFLCYNVSPVLRVKTNPPAKHNEVCHKSTPDFYQQYGGTRTCEEGLKCLYKKDPSMLTGVQKFCLDPKQDVHFDPISKTLVKPEPINDTAPAKHNEVCYESTPDFYQKYRGRRTCEEGLKCLFKEDPGMMTGVPKFCLNTKKDIHFDPISKTLVKPEPLNDTTPAKHNEVCYESTPNFYQKYRGRRTCEEGLKCLFKEDPGMMTGVPKFCLNPNENDHYDPETKKFVRLSPSKNEEPAQHNEICFKFSVVFYSKYGGERTCTDGLRCLFKKNHGIMSRVATKFCLNTEEDEHYIPPAQHNEVCHKSTPDFIREHGGSRICAKGLVCAFKKDPGMKTGVSKYCLNPKEDEYYYPPAEHNEICYKSNPVFYQMYGGMRKCAEGLKCLFRRDPGMKTGISKVCLNPKEDEHYDPSIENSFRKRR